MNRRLDQIINAFLKSHCDFSQPLLLGLSGGPDSLAMFYLLLKHKEKHQLQFSVAHVDHGWRVESSKEADDLKDLAERHGITFHLKNISPNQLQGNLEAACRLERLLFFKTLITEFGYQAVVLGHHADDQAETVLKRVLEGADLPLLCGLQEENIIEDIKIWRPLLSANKNEIFQWLRQHDRKAFDDHTNFDTKFLRARMRSEIIPYLSKAFGKEVTSSLNHLGKEALELKSYLKSCMGQFLDQIVKGPFGSHLDLSKTLPSHPFEIRYLIRELCRQENFLLPRALADSVCDLIISNKSDRQVDVGNHTLHIDRRRLFAMQDGTPSKLPVKTSLKSGRYSEWEISVKQSATTTPAITGWNNVCQGTLQITLPQDDYSIGPVDLHASFPGDHASISKWWTNEKVPAFLRQRIPVIWQGDRIVHEFLSGRQKVEKKEASLYMNIILKVASSQ